MVQINFIIKKYYQFNIIIIMSINLVLISGVSDASELHVPAQFVSIQSAIDAAFSGDQIIEAENPASMED
jgi:hypothetical protein